MFKLQKTKDDQSIPNEDLEKPDGRNTTKEPEVGEMDYKSFAQSLFNTSVMNLLHMTDPSQAAFLNPSKLAPVIDSSASGPEDPQAISTSQVKKNVSSEAVELEKNSAAQSARRPDNWIDVEESGTMHDSDRKTLPLRFFKRVGGITASTEDANSASKAQTDSVSQSPEQSSEIDKSILHRAQHQAWIEIHSPTLKSLLATTSDDFKMLKPVSFSSDRVLAYFSLHNVLSLWHGASNTDIQKDMSNLLRRLNRPSGALRPSEKGSRGRWESTGYVEFLRRSIGYICDTPHALLRSFVEWKENDDLSITARSYPLQTIETAFACIHTLDDSATMLSNLWTGVGSVYTRGLDGAKRNDFAAGISRDRLLTSASLDHALSDTEAAHIAKVALAALNASVGSVSTDVLDSVQQLRSKGQEVPATMLPEGPNSVGRHLYGNVLEALDRLENEAAVSLAVRLAKAMASRRWRRANTITERLHLADQVGRECQRLNFMTLVVRNIADEEGLQVKVHTNASPPSLHGGLSERCHKRQLFKGQDRHFIGKRLIVEWMRTVILKEWDGKPEVQKRGAVGGALEFLKHMCKQNPLEDLLICTHC